MSYPGEAAERRRRGSPRLSRRTLLRGAGLAGAAVTIGVSGCAGGAAGPLQFWNHTAPQEQGDPELVQQSNWITGAVEDWNAANDAAVEAVLVTDYVNPMNPRIATAFAADNGPDIFMISPGEFLRYYNGGVLVDLRPFMTDVAVDDFFPEALATRRIGEGIFALPMETEPLSIYYDEQAFVDAGLSEADLPTTWEAMLDVAEKLTTDQRAGLVLETAPGYYQNFTFYPWVWQGGGDVIDPTTGGSAVTGQAMVDALELFGESVRRGVSPRTLPTGGSVVTGFGQGLAAMWQRGPWSISEFALQAPEQRYGLFPLPLPPGGQQQTVAGGWAWAVNNRGRDPESAARFVVDTLGSMSPQSIRRCADWNGRAKSNLPARRSVTEATRSLPSWTDPARTALRAQADTARGEPRFPPVVYKAVSNAIQSVQLAGGDPRREAEIADQAISAFLSNYDGGPLL